MKYLTLLLTLTLFACGTPAPKAPTNNQNNQNNLNNLNNQNNKDGVVLTIANIGESSVYTYGTITMTDNNGAVVQLRNLCLPEPAVEPAPFEFRPGKTIEIIWDGTVFDADCMEQIAPDGEYFAEFCYGTELIDDFSIADEVCDRFALALGTDKQARLEIDYTARSDGEITEILLSNDLGTDIAIQASDNCQGQAWATVYDPESGSPVQLGGACGFCSCRDAALTGTCGAIFCADAACEAPRAEFMSPGTSRETAFYGVQTVIYEEEEYTCYQPALAPFELEVEICAGTQIIGEDFDSHVGDPVCVRVPFQRGQGAIEINASSFLLLE